jgi:hypothetical protein
LKQGLLFLALLLFLLGLYYYNSPQRQPASAKVAAAVDAPKAAKQPELTTAPAAAAAAAPQQTFPADTLNTPQSTGKEDVETLHRMLEHYLSALQRRGGPPLGDDKDLVRVLTGRNSMRVVFMPAKHHAISAEGRLLDRWGTPYHLHSLSSAKYEVRSAGPDRKLFNEDDLVWPEE